LNLIFVYCTLLVALTWHFSVSYGSEGPILSDENLTAERVAGGLENPTGIAFIAANDILVIEKDKGTVLRILNGEILPEPLLDLSVANEVERGLLGIAVSENESDGKTYVFLYHTEAESDIDGTIEGEEEDRSEGGVDSRVDGGEPIGNRLYRYELSEDRTKLVNPKLLLDLPYEPGPAHNGGVVTIDPDNNVYVVVGNLLATAEERFEGYSLDQNVQDGEAPDGRGGILRVTQDGKIVDGKGILGDEHPLDMYTMHTVLGTALVSHLIL
jgi:glucose/arabinose dehydrogenase